MIPILQMAYRDLGRNRRRSFFSALALGLGLAVLFMLSSVLRGELASSTEMALRLESGHVQLRVKDYNPDKTSLAWEDLIADPEQVAAQIASLPQVVSATPRLLASGIITTGDRSRGVRVLGIDPAAPGNAPYRDGMIAGDFLTADDRQGVLIGEALAKTYNLHPNDSLNLLVNTADGAIDQQTFVVRGIYSTGVPGYDGNTVFLPLAKAQTITQTEQHASIIFIMLKDRNQAAAVAAALQSDRYQAVIWQEMNQLLLATSDLSNSYMYMLYLIVLGITATVIVNTLIMSVFERTREIGILAAMGMKSRRIMTMFFAETSMLAVGGIVIGLVLGGLMVAYTVYIGFYIGDFGLTGMLLGERLYGQFHLQDAITLTVMAFIVTLLAGIYPAMVAANLEPVQALRGGK